MTFPPLILTRLPPPLYLFAFSLNVSSLILELLLAGRFVFSCTRTCDSLILIAENICPRELRAPEQRPWLRADDKRSFCEATTVGH